MPSIISMLVYTPFLVYIITHVYYKSKHRIFYHVHYAEITLHTNYVYMVHAYYIRVLVLYDILYKRNNVVILERLSTHNVYAVV